MQDVFIEKIKKSQKKYRHKEKIWYNFKWGNSKKSEEG